MTDTWTTSVVEEVWESQDQPGVTFSTAINPTIESGVSLPIAQSDVAGLVAALAGKASTAEVAALGVLPLHEVHVPLDAEQVGGGSWDGTTLTAAMLASVLEVGDLLLLTEQNDSARDGSYVCTAAGVFERLQSQPITVGNIGKLLPVRFDLSTNTRRLFRVADDGAGGAELEGLVVSEDEVEAVIAAYLVANPVEADTSEIEVDVESLAWSEGAAALPPARTLHFKGADRPGDATADYWSTPHVGPFTAGFLARVLFRVDGDWGFGGVFGEILTQPHDNGVGAHDNFEWAVFTENGTVNGVQYGELGQLMGFWEHSMQDQETAEDIQVVTDMRIGLGLWCHGLMWVDFGTTTARMMREVHHAGDFTTADDGRQWRLMGTWTDSAFASIDAGGDHWTPEEWWVGNNFCGHIATVTIHDGATLDGTEITPGAAMVDIDVARDCTPGDTSFTDGEGNTWTTIDGEVVASTEERLEDLAEHLGLELIDRAYLASDAAEVELTGLAEFSSVLLIVEARSDRTSNTAGTLLTCNDDTGTNYAQGATTGNASCNLGVMPAASATAGRYSWTEVRISNHPGRAHHIVADHRLDQLTASGFTNSGFAYTATDPVDTVQIFSSNSANLVAGTCVTALGVRA